MRPFTWFMAFVMLGAAAPLAAQEEAPSIRDIILRSARLPEVTKEARVLGVPEQDIRTIFGTAREQRIPAGVLTEVMVTQNEAVREHGPVENFGAFVQAKLAQGMRGRELAAAIRAEHAAHGVGKGTRLPGAAMGAGQGKGRGAVPAEAGKAPGGKPESPGKSGDAGKPESQGKSGGGKPETAGQQGKDAGKGGS
jgi:hypothetical protein